MVLLYLAGPPGVGKSTLMATLTARCARTPGDGPVAHDHLTRDGTTVAAEIGRRRESFSGTDALSMSIAPIAARWVATRPHEVLLGEGARLAAPGFLLAARAAGYRVILGLLDAPDPVLEVRRRQRGSTQNPAWVKGASSRARRLPARLSLDVDAYVLDALLPAEALADSVAGMDPALEVLRA